MTYRVLWPMIRWPDGRDIEEASVADGGVAEFCERYADVTNDQWANCDALVCAPDVPDEYRSRLDKCRIFVTPKVGFDNIDLAAWGALGIPVCNVPDYGTQEVADHAIALMMSLMKGITFHTRELKKDPRVFWRPALNPYGKRLSASTFGVVGLGRIGTAAALRAKAFGMDVVFYDPYVSNGSDLAIGVRRVHSLTELFSISDAVSVHAPLSDETTKLINAEVLAASKPGLVLINTARGPIIDLDALYEAMRTDQVRAAGLDVLPEEPANPEHPLIESWAADEEWIDHRLLITPHSAFYTPESVYDMRFKGGEVALTYLSSGRLQNCVNETYLQHRR
ncbi:MAG: C-terminal binding protein [Pseudomonadales bacterium]|jgi:lactate dehydrogenase-like 2-hydroxyacid dehydrogenase|nr:C-terminal binding protein [Pseudomonadales bacterium]MDP6470206.1 C-terminal binding protein [Pseudomonadales bacterium]MDP6827112.1 C-terminal binding protein [Pseudomonadales bacterium]MDP6971550.1 C-terminal binding protein [Pseudomonadales bacterium]|tara:strand:+ start:547 stop:1557 length:1011 start_codon:yes stop_codon:yes gene_type:complete